MRINWFSPLPPSRTAAAWTTRNILPTLSKASSLRLWTDGRDSDPATVRAAEVRVFDPARMDWAELNRIGINVYHLDDDPTAHGGIWRVSRRAPGILVLHDHRLHRLVAGVHRARESGREEYLSLMERQYGENGRHDALSFWEGWTTPESMSRSYPLTHHAAERALGVVVHTREALRALEGRLTCPVRRLPLPHPARARAAAREPRGPLTRLVSFTHGRDSRTLELLLALAEHPRRHAFRLDVYGASPHEEALRERVWTLGLGDRAALHAPPRELELDQALDLADAAVNLRHPPASEAAAIQLRVWEHGLPSIVTRSGWLGEIPETAAFFVRPDHEAEDLRDALSALLDDPARFRRMGAAGRTLLEREHGPAAYARGILELCEEGVRLRPGLAAAAALRRAGEESARLSVETGDEEGPLPRLTPHSAPDPAERERGPVADASRRVLTRWQSELGATLRNFAEAVDERVRAEGAESGEEA